MTQNDSVLRILSYVRTKTTSDRFGRLTRDLDRAPRSTSVETANGGIKYLSPAKFFAPDGKQLIPEGDDFFRTAFGVRFKITD